MRSAIFQKLFDGYFLTDIFHRYFLHIFFTLFFKNFSTDIFDRYFFTDIFTHIFDMCNVIFQKLFGGYFLTDIFSQIFFTHIFLHAHFPLFSSGFARVLSDKKAECFFFALSKEKANSLVEHTAQNLHKQNSDKKKRS